MASSAERGLRQSVRKAAQTLIISRIHMFWNGRKLSTNKIKV